MTPTSTPTDELVGARQYLGDLYGPDLLLEAKLWVLIEAALNKPEEAFTRWWIGDETWRRFPWAAGDFKNFKHGGRVFFGGFLVRPNVCVFRFHHMSGCVSPSAVEEAKRQESGGFVRKCTICHYCQDYYLVHLVGYSSENYSIQRFRVPMIFPAKKFPSGWYLAKVTCWGPY